MSKKGKHKNTLLKIELVCAIAKEHYEPGNQARSYKAIYRKYVYPVYPMCYHTFLSYINTPLGELRKKTDEKQLNLFE